MSADEQRLRGLKRIVKLQTQMRRREEWHLARLEREDHALAQREADLTAFMNAETSVSALMAGSTARRLRNVAEGRARLRDEKVDQTARLLAQQQRLASAEQLCDDIGAMVSRAREDEDLDAVTDAEIARRQASLP